ncbi:MAG: hypothetical protein E7378_04070 [Clostridiales bacterium]|nr:hypothetical protein [Clostridiales bacterium]
MPRGYELSSYYDAQRAMQRKIYSSEIREISSQIAQFKYMNDGLYSLVIAYISRGLYDNMGSLYSKTHLANKTKEYIGNNKSSRSYDFMSPLELRLNSIAVRRAIQNIKKLKPHMAGVKDMQTACYLAGQSVALEFQKFKSGKGVFDMKISDPVMSVTPILKKYNKALTLGTWPKGEPVEYKDSRKDKIQQLILDNELMLAYIQQKLFQMGFYSNAYVIKFLQSVNQAYYFVEGSKPSTLEIADAFDCDQQKNNYYYTELCMNLEKLVMVKNMLETSKYYGNNFYALCDDAKKMGAKARSLVVAKYGMLPEMFPCFYEVFSRGESATAYIKQSIKKQARQLTIDDQKTM